jgi:hypothetical protein
MSSNVWPPLGADAPARHFSKKARNKFQRLTEEGGKRTEDSAARRFGLLVVRRRRGRPPGKLPRLA